ncbi:MAG: hypothetical protein ACOCQD_02850 [archaeon]
MGIEREEEITIERNKDNRKIIFKISLHYEDDQILWNINVIVLKKYRDNVSPLVSMESKSRDEALLQAGIEIGKFLMHDTPSERNSE